MTATAKYAKNICALYSFKLHKFVVIYMFVATDQQITTKYMSIPSCCNKSGKIKPVELIICNKPVDNKFWESNCNRLVIKKLLINSLL